MVSTMYTSDSHTTAPAMKSRIFSELNLGTFMIFFFQCIESGEGTVGCSISRLTVKYCIYFLVCHNCYRINVSYQSNPYPNRLRVTRQAAGFTQLQVALLLGYSNSNALCAWENEHTMPNGTNLIKLCMLYRKTPAELYPEYIKQIDFHLLIL